MKKNIVFALLIINSLISGPAFAFGPHPTYKLDWGQPNESLEYHSMGCADACWVASLKDKKTHKSKIELTCTGVNSPFDLTASYITSGKKVILETGCDLYSSVQTNEKDDRDTGPDKFSRITAAMKSAVDLEKNKK